MFDININHRSCKCKNTFDEYIFCNNFTRGKKCCDVFYSKVWDEHIKYYCYEVAIIKNNSFYRISNFGFYRNNFLINRNIFKISDSKDYMDNNIVIDGDNIEVEFLEDYLNKYIDNLVFV